MNYTRQERELKATDQVLDLKGWHTLGYVGFRPLDWLTFDAGIGATKASIADDDGEAGLDWMVQARANFLDYVMQSSPVFGKQQSVTLGALLSYQRSESNPSDQDFHWNETVFSPIVTYAVNLRGPGNWQPYEPLAASIKAGLVLSGIDGKLGDQDLSENRNFGFTLGADLQFNSGFVLGMDMVRYGESDWSFTASLSYNL